MMKYLKKLLVVSGLFVLSASGYADAYLRAGPQYNGWVFGDFTRESSILRKNDIRVVGYGQRSAEQFWVSGRHLCNGVFLLQSVKNGVNHDVVFADRQLAEEFIKEVQEQRGGTGSDIYAQYTWGGVRMRLW